MQRRKRLNLLNILYYYVQQCIASSNNNNLDTKSHLFTEIVIRTNVLIKGLCLQTVLCIAFFKVNCSVSQMLPVFCYETFDFQNCK